VTGLLKAWGQGDEAALNALIPLVHEFARAWLQQEMTREAGRDA
jgi:hypothetical protein